PQPTAGTSTAGGSDPAHQEEAAPHQEEGRNAATTKIADHEDEEEDEDVDHVYFASLEETWQHAQ
ncbi:unnamed protein product, partial [Amoebophrya sp. A25]